MATNNSININTGISGTVLQGTGVGSAPVFSTATYPSTAGTSGNVLTSDGTNFSSSQPPWFLIQQQSASAVASVTFINIGAASYSVYLLTFRSLIPATDGATLRMQMSNDNGGTWITSSYLSGINTAPYNSTTWTNTNSTADFILTGPLDNGNSNSTGHGWVNIFLVPANLPHIAGNVTQFNNTDATVSMGIITGRGGSTGMNAIKLLMSSGNITNGKFSLYALAGN